MKIEKNQTLAKYLRKVTDATRPYNRRSQYDVPLIGSDNKKYYLSDHYGIQKGSIVLIAKKHPTFKGQPEQWTIHEVEVAYCRFQFAGLQGKDNTYIKKWSYLLSSFHGFSKSYIVRESTRK